MSGYQAQSSCEVELAVAEDKIEWLTLLLDNLYQYVANNDCGCCLGTSTWKHLAKDIRPIIFAYHGQEVPPDA